MSEGKRLVASLKRYIVEQMTSEPACGAAAPGLGSNEIEELCDLALNLDSQDHYLTRSLLRSLVKDSIIERVVWLNKPKRPKYRLRETAGHSGTEVDAHDQTGAVDA